MSPRSLGLLLSVVITAGCETPPEPTDDAVDEVGAVVGVDYAWSHPTAAALHQDGYRFAARYLSYDTAGKNLSAGEAQGLWASGVDIVVVWEQTADAALAGYNQGRSDAAAANAQAAGDGIPGGRPIYFAVDFDATPGQQPAIDAYFDGAASVLGRDRVGAYGGFYVVKRLFDAGKIAWGWQTYAWSGGQWDGRAQLRQVQNGVSVGGAFMCCDRDQAVAADYGQWHAQSVGSDGCTAQEDHDAASFGCFCVDHKANGGYCPGTGCTATETHNAGEFGCGCVDHRASGAFCDGTGCTPRETLDAASFGCQCVDHEASGGFCDGSGCTAKETKDAAYFGCQCVDHKGDGGFCPGSGCTAKETNDAAKFGCGCVDHKASGGFCPGTGCTAKETNDCKAAGKSCSLHKCS